MYSKTLLDQLMKTRNYEQYKQAAAELEFTTGYIAMINRGQKEFSDETGIYIANECGLDPQEVVLKLAEARAKTPRARSVWAEAVKSYCSGAKAASWAGLGLFAALATTQFKFALCILC